MSQQLLQANGCSNSLSSDIIRLMFWTLSFQFSYILKTYNPSSTGGILFPVVISFLSLLSRISSSFAKSTNRKLSECFKIIHVVLIYLNPVICIVELCLALPCLLCSFFPFPLFSIYDRKLGIAWMIVNLLITRGILLVSNLVVFYRTSHRASGHAFLAVLAFFPYYFIQAESQRWRFGVDDGPDIMKEFKTGQWTIFLCILSLISVGVLWILDRIKASQNANQVTVKTNIKPKHSRILGREGHKVHVVHV